MDIQLIITIIIPAWMDGILVDETAKVTMISFFIVSEFQGLFRCERKNRNRKRNNKNALEHVSVRLWTGTSPTYYMSLGNNIDDRLLYIYEKYMITYVIFPL